MGTREQIEELQTVLCGCDDQEFHTLGDDGCAVIVKPGSYGSWKPAPTGYRLPRIRVEDIYTELARHATSPADRALYRRQAATARYAGKY